MGIMSFNNYKYLILILSTLMATGCALMHKPTQEQIVNADYGTYPDDYKAIVSSYIDRTLIDPDSMRLSDWKGPSRGYIYDYSGAYFGYRVCAEVNAKNRMGGYVGRQPYFFT